MPFYIIDIILKFLTMYIDDVTLIKDSKLIALKYLKYQFWIDFIPTLPLFYITEGLMLFRFTRLLNAIYYIIQLDQMLEDLILRFINLK